MLRSIPTDPFKQHIASKLVLSDLSHLAATSQYYRQIYQDHLRQLFVYPCRLLYEVKYLTVAQLAKFLLAYREGIINMYQSVIANKQSSPSDTKAAEFFKALVMDVGKHQEEGITLEILLDIQVFLNSLPDMPMHLHKSINFLIHLLTQITQKYPDPNMYEASGFLPWTYQVYRDDVICFKNLRGFNLCFTNLSEGNWQNACFIDSNVRSTYFGNANLDRAQFTFNENLFPAMITMCHLKRALPKIIYFPDPAIESNIVATLDTLAKHANLHDNYLALHSTESVCGVHQLDMFPKMLDIRNASDKLFRLIQGEVLNQLLAIVHVQMKKGEYFNGLALLKAAKTHAFFSQDAKETIKHRVQTLFMRSQPKSLCYKKIDAATDELCIAAKTRGAPLSRGQ